MSSPMAVVRLLVAGPFPVALLALQLNAAPLPAQSVEATVAPALLDADDGRTLGVRGRLDWRSGGVALGPRPRRWAGEGEVDLPVTWHPDRNPESLRAEGRFLYLIALTTGGGGEPDQLEGPALDEGPTRWGFLKVGIEGGVEALQRLDDADVALGVSMAYDHDLARLWFLPGVDLRYALVACVGCEPPATSDHWVPFYTRLDLRGRWSIPFGRFTAALDPLRLRLTGRYFRAGPPESDLQLFRDQRGVWGRVALAWHTERPAWLHEVYVGWKGGELPVSTADDHAWTAGITLIL